MLLRPFFLSCVFTLATVNAQHLSFGIIGGAGVTDAYPTQTFPVFFPGDSVITGTRYFSPAKDYAVGGMFELRLPAQWSVEVDGMFRELHLTWAAVQTDGKLNSISPAPVVTWEFPVLVKRRFRWSRVNPFLEAGPSFRTTGNLNAQPSHHGATAGAGVEMRLHGLVIAPALPYTHWAKDPAEFGNVHSRQNQMELLVGLSRATAPNLHPFGKYVTLGATAGLSFTADYPSAPPNVFEFRGTRYTTLFAPGAHTFFAGPTLELGTERISAEIDAVYRPLRVKYTTLFSDGRPASTSQYTVSTWEFPVLAKYRLPAPAVAHFARPFVEAGPSFRIPFTVTNYGITAGAGIELHAHGLRFAPTVRYTHWQAEGGAKPNQVGMILGFSF